MLRRPDTAKRLKVVAGTHGAVAGVACLKGDEGGKAVDQADKDASASVALLAPDGR